MCVCVCVKVSVECTEYYVRGASRVMNRTGNQHPPFAVDHQCPVIIRHIDTRRHRRRRRRHHQKRNNQKLCGNSPHRSLFVTQINQTLVNFLG